MPSKKNAKGVLGRIGDAATSAAQVVINAGSKAIHAVGDMMPTGSAQNTAKASPKSVKAKPRKAASKTVKSGSKTIAKVSKAKKNMAAKPKAAAPKAKKAAIKKAVPARSAKLAPTPTPKRKSAKKR